MDPALLHHLQTEVALGGIYVSRLDQRLRASSAAEAERLFAAQVNANAKKALLHEQRVDEVLVNHDETHGGLPANVRY